MDHDSVNGITIPTPKMAGTFPRFLDLPKEIRLLIWELTYPRNRVIQVISTRFYKEFENWQLDAKGSHWTISSTSPIALDVCKESRESIAVYWYKKFAVENQKGQRDVWWNPAIDII